MVLHHFLRCRVIIGLLGGKGAGKSTVAAHLAWQYGAHIYALADELKELLRHTFLLSQEQLHGTQAQKEAVDVRWGLSPRQLMERQGDAIRHVYGDMFQIARVMKHIETQNARLAVISDIRYKHEADAIRHHGVLWRVHYAPGVRQWPGTHSSERDWPLLPVDLEIIPGANGHAELYAAVDDACVMSEIEKDYNESARY